VQKHAPPRHKATDPYRRTLAARQICLKVSLYLDFRRTSMCFAARPCYHPFAAKHMLLCLPQTPLFRQSYNTMTIPTCFFGFCHLKNSIMRRKSKAVTITLFPEQLHNNISNPIHPR